RLRRARHLHPRHAFRVAGLHDRDDARGACARPVSGKAGWRRTGAARSGAVAHVRAARIACPRRSDRRPLDRRAVHRARIPRRPLQAAAMSHGPDVLARHVGDIAARAAAAILEVYRSDFAVTSKDDRSPLTAADLAANRVIVDGLRELTPDIPVLSEESAAVAWSERSRWQRYWLVDPLDGTREFIKRNGEFTV